MNIIELPQNSNKPLNISIELNKYENNKKDKR